MRALLRNQAHLKVVPQRRAFRVRVIHGFPLCPIRGRFQNNFRAFWEELRSSTLVTQLRPGLPGLRGQPLNRVSQPEPTKPKEATELLAEVLKSVIKKPDDDDKPNAKEAETVKLPDFPNPETYRSWKITVREAVRAASDKPDEAFKWVQEVYERNATMELLRETASS